MLRLCFLLFFVSFAVYAADRTHAGSKHKSWARLRRSTNTRVDAASLAREQLMTLSREALVQMVMDDEDEIAEMVNSVGEETGPPTRVKPLTSDETASILGFMTANPNTLPASFATAVGLNQFTPIPPDTSFLETRSRTKLPENEDLVDMGGHAILRRNGDKQYVVVYGLDSDGTWWTHKTEFWVVGKSHAEVEAKRARVFERERWPKPFVELLLFSFNSPCTTNHGKGLRIESCKDLVVRPMIEAYGGEVGVTVMFYTWYLSGTIGVGGDQARLAEYQAYLADEALVEAAKSGIFQLVLLGSNNIIKTLMPPQIQ